MTLEAPIKDFPNFEQLEFKRLPNNLETRMA
jgi:hypothetical protein